MLSVSIDEDNIIPYILNNLGNTELAFKLASRGGLPGADDLYVARFNQLFSTGNFGEAAKIAATSPRVSCLLFILTIFLTFVLKKGYSSYNTND